MKIPERYLYHAWDGRHFSPEMETISRKKVKILFPGYLNTNAGPDYHHAVLELNGKVFRGDIEIHLKTNDWLAHLHHEDPVYNHVILHVVLEHNGRNPFTITENGNRIEILELLPFLEGDITQFQPGASQFTDREPFCAFFAGMQPDQVKIVLNHYGMERLQRRVSRFQAEAHFNDLDQLLYQSIMEAMGYRQNQFPLLILAEQIPLKKIRQWIKDGMTADELYAIYIVSSGLISRVKPESEKEHWYEAYKRQKFFHTSIPCDWNLFRIRPAHHPVKRLAHFAHFICSGSALNWLNHVHRIFKEHSHERARLEDNLMDWFESRESSMQNRGQWGRNFVRLLTLNALIPLEILNARKLKDRNLESRIIEAYRTYPGLPENAQLRNMKGIMTPGQVMQLKNSAIRQLGLQQLFRESCTVHDCQVCITHKSKILSSL